MMRLLLQRDRYAKTVISTRQAHAQGYEVKKHEPHDGRRLWDVGGFGGMGTMRDMHHPAISNDHMPRSRHQPPARSSSGPIVEEPDSSEPAAAAPLYYSKRLWLRCAIRAPLP